jgi:hypothetical protein
MEAISSRMRSISIHYNDDEDIRAKDAAYEDDLDFVQKPS